MPEKKKILIWNLSNQSKKFIFLVDLKKKEKREFDEVCVHEKIKKKSTVIICLF